MTLGKIKILAKDSFIYGLSGIINRMITIFLVPVYTRIFLPGDYGIISLVNTTFFLAGILAICALDSASARWYYDAKDETDRKKIFSSWFWFQLLLSGILGLLLLASLPLFAVHVFNIPSSELWLIWLLPCATLVANILPNLIWNWYRLERKPKATVIYNLSLSITTIILTIVFVVLLKWHIAGVYAALFISNLVFSLIALVSLKSWIHIRYFDRVLIRQMLKFAIPMVPAAIAYWLINSTAAYFILFMEGQARGTQDVGLFTVGATIASVVSLFTAAFQQAWGPFAFSIANEPGAKKTYASVFLLFGLFSSVIILGMFLFAPEILMIFTNVNYYDSAWVASILSINVIFIAFTYIASIGTSIMKNSLYYSKGVLLGAIGTMIFNFLLIPKVGKEGAAIATVLGQVLVLLYLFYYAQKLYPIFYNFKKVSFFLLLGMGFGVLGRLIPYANLTTAVLIKTVILIAFIILIALSIRSVTQLVFSKPRLIS